MADLSGELEAYVVDLGHGWILCCAPLSVLRGQHLHQSHYPYKATPWDREVGQTSRAERACGAGQFLHAEEGTQSTARAGNDEAKSEVEVPHIVGPCLASVHSLPQLLFGTSTGYTRTTCISLYVPCAPICL